MQHLYQDDPELNQLVDKERQRIDTTLDLIAAENHAPPSIMETLGSILNTKTIEGYPGKRFHAGCQYVDEIENLAIARGKALFDAEHINVQPHSGTSANLAVYFSVLDVGDKILSMSLPHGGHLSHGHRASMTSKCFQFEHYRVDPKTERIDYDQIQTLAQTFQPKMIVAGASSYPRLIDYQKIATIAQSVSAYFFVDMAHLAGLVAAGVIPSPVSHSDFVTFTAYKTMMGGRGGVILCRQPFAKRIDSAVFPGCQGTSAVNMIAAKALIFKLARQPHFLEVQQRTIDNAVVLSDHLQQRGYRVVSGGTDNHQVLLDLRAKQISGDCAEKALESAGIILNRNVIPQDADTPGRVSGLRIGSAGVSARGMGKAEMVQICDLMDRVLNAPSRPETIEAVNHSVQQLCRQFPVY